MILRPRPRPAGSKLSSVVVKSGRMLAGYHLHKVFQKLGVASRAEPASLQPH